MKSKTGIILILLGISIAIFPLADRLYTWYEQNKALENYEELDSVFEEAIIAEEEATSLSTEAAIQPTSLAPTEITTGTAAVAQPTPKVTPIGILQIDKINLKLPILAGATNKNMKIGVGWIKETTPIGETGNIALAAHRSYTYGRFFNRLDEIQVGDHFTVTANGEEYQYEVFNKLVVLPTDTSVLKRNNRDKIVTLITCTPIRKATHRLIIQGKLIE